MYATTIFGLTALLAITGKINASVFEPRNVYEAALAARQNTDEEAYLNSVCFPNVTASAVIPPCQEIVNIESACLPNGTSTLDLIAHAQCMCGGSYFEDWIGCLNCDYVHGARSPAVTSAFHTILTSASNQLCTGTPTASFQAIFSSLNYNPAANGTATDVSDLYPSQTAVSLYFTPTGAQGPGAITGSATLATKTASAGSGSSTSGSGSGSGSKTSVTGLATTQGGSQSSSTSSSKGGAAPTGVWMGGLGLAAGVVGMVVL